MKRAVSILVFLAFALVSCSTDEYSPTAAPTAPMSSITESETAPVTTYALVTPITFADLDQLRIKHNLKIRTVRVTYPGLTIQYDIPAGGIPAARVDFHRQHAAFIDFIREQQSPSARNTLPDDTRQTLNELLAAEPSLSLKISMIGVVENPGTQTSAPELQLRDNVQLSSPPRGTPGRTPQGQAPEQLNSMRGESWAPYGGTSQVSRTVSYQTFFFNRAEAFNDRQTYEHECQVYDVNFANYGGYSVTNLPEPYVYNENHNGVDGFEVGSAHANLIQNGKQYLTYQTLTPQTSSSALIRIKGQLHQRPSWCPGWWCASLLATTPSMATHYAPGAMSWQY